MSVYVKSKTQIRCAVSSQLISTFVFAKRIVQFVFFLNPIFQASSPFYAAAQVGTQKTGVLSLRLIFVGLY